MSVARPTQYASKIDYQNFAFLINKVLRAQKGEEVGIGEREKKVFSSVVNLWQNHG